MGSRGEVTVNGARKLTAYALLLMLPLVVAPLLEARAYNGVDDRIEGYVYENGVGRSGLTVHVWRLTNEHGATGALPCLEGTTTTDADGFFAVAYLYGANSYRVDVHTPVGVLAEHIRFLSCGDPATRTFHYAGGAAEVDAENLTTVLLHVEKEGATHLFSVTTNSTITDLQFHRALNQISFDVAGANGTRGFLICRVPTKLLAGSLTVRIDRAPITPLVAANSTHTSMYIAYAHSHHRIDIVGTVLGPEVPPVVATASMVILVLALPVLLVTARMRRH